MSTPSPRPHAGGSGLDNGAREQPILWVGMAGFSPDQRADIEGLLARPLGLPCWRTSGFAEADAWLLNGAKCQLRAGGNLDIAPGLPTEKLIKLDMGQVDRPVAFATPLASDEVEPRWTFDPSSKPSVQSLLRQLDAWLRVERVKFVLGGQLIRQGASLRHGVFHLTYHGILAATLDFRKGTAGLSPKLNPVDLLHVEWHQRPDGAGDIPTGFVQSSPAQLAWTYVRRTDRDMLPAQYRKEIIHFRRVPRVPVRLLGDIQLMLLRELGAESSTLVGLTERTGLTCEQVERALACLYYAGSITTTSSKAAHRPTIRAADGSGQSENPASLLGDHPPAAYSADPTVPAQIKRH